MIPTVSIVGTGIVSSLGSDTASFARSLKSGASGIVKTAESLSGLTVAAELRGFRFAESLEAMEGIPPVVLATCKRLGARAPIAIQISILSALQAWRAGGLFRVSPDGERVGIIVAGQNTTQNYQYGHFDKFKENPAYLSPKYALEFMDSNHIGVLSEILGIRGEGLVVGGASASGNVGIIKGLDSIRSGRVDICLVIGVMADLSPMEIQGFVNLGAMGGKKFRDLPEMACRPFDEEHEGFIYGQAGACIVLESESSAAHRAVEPQAILASGCIHLDGNSSSNPSLTGEVRAMRSALEQAGCGIDDIDYINTHGSSSPLGDRTEAEALVQVLGECSSQVLLNSTKGLVGHCLWSAGVVELIATLEQMNGGFIHPNRNLENPIRQGLRFAGDAAIPYSIHRAMSNSYGFGGINSSIILRR